jgi:hypothetical protein
LKSKAATSHGRSFKDDTDTAVSIKHRLCRENAARCRGEHTAASGLWEPDIKYIMVRLRRTCDAEPRSHIH